jgi:hypothetical protein
VAPAQQGSAMHAPAMHASATARTTHGAWLVLAHSPAPYGHHRLQTPCFAADSTPCCCAALAPPPSPLLCNHHRSLRAEQSSGAQCRWQCRLRPPAARGAALTAVPSQHLARPRTTSTGSTACRATTTRQAPVCLQQPWAHQAAASLAVQEQQQRARRVRVQAGRAVLLVTFTRVPMGP